MGNLENVARRTGQRKPWAVERAAKRVRARTQADPVERQRRCRERKQAHALVSSVEPNLVEVSTRDIQ